ncbi:hypothetical protein OS493_030361 [Desmophyllum pertusum]|uniref:Uncharacterized protein n=1 Tax=Desmophyllum pertusum TaxID=174260 RepID=A0A9W9Z8Q8_9CNID|nr:hypothetical protein OS493_030361 [Desmophyllum pertusum]
MLKNMTVLEKYSGKTFPPQVVDAFASNIEPLKDSLARFYTKKKTQCRDSPLSMILESKTLAAKSFKENPTREQMKNYLLASIFPRSRWRDRAPDRAKCVSMWDNIQADDQQQDVTPPTTSRRQPSTSRAHSAQRAGRSSQSPVVEEMVDEKQEREEEQPHKRGSLQDALW